MKIGVPQEIKNHEYRVGMTPGSVREAVMAGHQVLVQQGAGLGIGADDALYTEAGGTICPDTASIFAEADMIVKVKEPQPQEVAMLRQGQILYTYLHLAADKTLTQGLLDSGCIGIAYETITDALGRLPLLAPMSEVAGRMSIQAGAHALEKAHSGRGVLLSGVPGVSPGKVVVLGGGVAGTNAARVAVGMGADVTILESNGARLRALDDLFQGRARIIASNRSNLEALLGTADLVVGSVLIPGAAAPKLITKDMLAGMLAGSVVVDICIDQGGCLETSKPTTHQDPTYLVDEVVHYCVANMPGAVARTSTYALNNATLHYLLTLANKGWQQACKDDANLCAGLNLAGGTLTLKAVGEAHGMDTVAPNSVL